MAEPTWRLVNIKKREINLMLILRIKLLRWYLLMAKCLPYKESFLTILVKQPLGFANNVKYIWYFWKPFCATFAPI